MKRNKNNNRKKNDIMNENEKNTKNKHTTQTNKNENVQKARKTQHQDELKTTQVKLQAAMEDADKLPPHKMWKLRSRLSGWPAKAGLGVDLWVLKLWANLPEPALRMLLLILSLMEEGHLPMQTLMVLIGLLPKPKGGGKGL